MHTNYYFLRKLTGAIRDRWTGAIPAALYTQEKNELIIHARNGNGDDLYLKAHLQPDFCCLSFPEAHHRARKNSMNLFSRLEGLEIRQVRQFENERAFAFIFPEELMLVFKMYGNRSNLILFEEQKVLEVFRSELKKDYTLVPDLDRPIDQRYEAFKAAGGDFRALFPTFGKRIGAWLADKNYESLDMEGRWSLITKVLDILRDPEFHVVERDDFYLTLLPAGRARDFQDPVEALNYFFNQYFHQGLLNREKQSVRRRLERNIVRSEKYIRRLYSKLEELSGQSSYRLQADLLMANLHRIPKGTRTVSLPDFHDPDHQVTISVNPALSPQDNAAHLYQKAKNQHLEIHQLEKNIGDREKQLEEDRKHLEEIHGIHALRALRHYVSENALEESPEAKQGAHLPYREYQVGGFAVRVGKNARANDEMLQQYSYKDDLWLHAKDVSGSHVLIKYQAGRPIPPSVRETAASLAAYYSKRRNDTLCPVIVTPRKYIRKRKGDPAGAVVVDREQEVLLVPPADLKEI